MENDIEAGVFRGLHEGCRVKVIRGVWLTSNPLTMTLVESHASHKVHNMGGRDDQNPLIISSQGLNLKK